MAKCHPDRLNHYLTWCQECYEAMQKPECFHPDRVKNKFGRCEPCQKRYYAIRCKQGIGEKFGTPRISRTFSHIKDPVLRYKTVKRKCRLAKYNLTFDQYDQMLASQKGVCAICNTQPTGDIPLSIDHDHTCCPYKRSCGKCIRGLVCNRCNTQTGLLESMGTLDSGLLSNIVKYLAKSNQKWAHVLNAIEQFNNPQTTSQPI